MSQESVKKPTVLLTDKNLIWSKFMKAGTVTVNKSRSGQIYPGLRDDHFGSVDFCPVHGYTVHAEVLGGCVDCANEMLEEIEKEERQKLAAKEEEQVFLLATLDQAIAELS